MKKVLIEVGAIELNAELNDSETAQAIYNILPVSGPVNVFGRIQGNATILKKVSNGDQVKVSKEE